jgi:sigma-B regulation protein RsbQ
MDVLQRHNISISGSGPVPMVFAHGFGCDQTMWRHVAPAFQADHKVVLFDHVGCGKSDLASYHRTKYGRLDGYADDVLAILRALDLPPVVFVGHSVGALIGILAAIEDPARFDRLVLVAPSPRYVDDDDGYVGGLSREDVEGLLDLMDANYMGWSQAAASLIMGHADRPELAGELSASFCRTDPDIARDFARVTFLSDNRADLPKVTVPALILQCAEDAIAPACVGRYMHAAMPGSRLTMMAATGHCPNLSAPEETVAAIRAFLA